MAETLYYSITHTDLAEVLVARSHTGVCSILLSDDHHKLVADAAERFSNCRLARDDDALRPYSNTIAAHIGHPLQPLDIQFDLRGTAFQISVWQALRSIAPGSTTTYTELAQVLKRPNAVRAVANACAANPLAVVVPCHRVVRRDGSLGGYRWGLQRKRQLLQQERRGDPTLTSRAGSSLINEHNQRVRIEA